MCFKFPDSATMIYLCYFGAASHVNSKLSVGNQASEHRCEEVVTQLPESTRPLLRQIEAMQVQ